MKTFKLAKSKAWKSFSLYIRTLNSVDGVNECYTCGKVIKVNHLQAGHGIAGRNNSILFSEEIVKPQCVGCNLYGRGQYAKFTRKLIDELGLDQYDEIVRQSNRIVKYTLEDYQRIEQEYKEKLNEL